MGIQYFYNFCIAQLDDTDLESDILSAVRKSYFASFEKIRDKITYDSEGVSLLYDYGIERDKPLRWTVKNPHGGIVQEVIQADGGRYYLNFYRGDQLYKRLLFSKLHTLLKAEYMDDSGVVCRSIEPRRTQVGLCLLYTDNRLSDPVVLYAAPDVRDERVLDALRESFTDYTAVAGTNEGVVWYLSDEQIARFKAFVDQKLNELEKESEVSFVDGETPLFDKINVKDFNMKRNLSASLDISQAKDFDISLPQKEQEPEALTEEAVEESGTEPEANDRQAETAPAEEAALDEAAAIDEEAQTEDTKASDADKVIMADGAEYRYYGELDSNGDRSGYGRTVTDEGRTAYEGCYLNDKRSGKGAYFYRDGSLCYSGDWAENARHGVGVGVSARDGSMHIGRWRHNKPEGNGVRLSAEGEIKFVCRELSDGGTVLMHYLKDDTVLISKYDENGAKLSEKSVSLTDFS